jgi:uncharacterized protein YjbI with pentapeptide repeats
MVATVGEMGMRRSAQSQSSSFSGADLRRTSLWGTALGTADLAGAALQTADLSRVNLNGAKLTGSIYDRRTRWPNTFDPMGTER